MEIEAGMSVKIKLSGDDNWYSGVVLTTSKKKWVKITDDFYIGNIRIADENNIVDWELNKDQN